MKQSTSAEEEITIYAGILAAIKVVVREEMGVISARLDNIDKTLVKLVEVQQRLVEVEEGLQFTSERLNTLAAEVMIPSMADHMARIAESLAHQTLQIDMHRPREEHYHSWYRGSSRGVRACNPRQVHSVCSRHPQSRGCCPLALGCLPEPEPKNECWHNPALPRSRPA